MKTIEVSCAFLLHFLEIYYFFSYFPTLTYFASNICNEKLTIWMVHGAIATIPVSTHACL
jgi:hypothetical protein